jgi:hypothetical protein
MVQVYMFLKMYQCYGRICGHNTEYGYNDKYTGTRNVILAKYCLWLPDDGLHKPKHVGATDIILNVLIIHILI